ncbi:unnamed protein product [Phyllotreta striolata]|uniref:UDP-glucuronosyltransferase n=1 Tax=Phyllotreta striolata TaxID=444603 RepID=A0A9N9TL32_PHYSR|nr:unnamed protein product [Phyllotreta striolata]
MLSLPSFCIGLLVFVVPLLAGYRILVVFPCITHSHYSLGLRLLNELADRGHDVTFISSFPQKNRHKNITHVSVEEIREPSKVFLSNLFGLNELSFHKQLDFISEYGKFATLQTLQSRNVQDLMKSNVTFDLVLLEQFLNEAMAIFAYRFKCPEILLIPGPTSFFNNHLIGNFAPISIVPNYFSNYDNYPMNFWDRLYNVYLELVSQYVVNFSTIPGQNKALKQAFPDAPDLETILYNTSLSLVLSDLALDDPMPLQQNIKPIAGYHLPSHKPLPADIQAIMDNSKDGVVIFSLGSNLNSSQLNPQLRKIFLNVFSKIKQTVLWKFETDLPEKPENVKIANWLPQFDALAHPNTAAFISHGGLLGTLEAIHSGVPVLGLPVYWDQQRNVRLLARRGMAIELDRYNLNERNFENALKEILNNPRYSLNAKKSSRILQDRPVKAIDEAVFWIEYVIRHQGAPHLRSPFLDFKWYQIYLLDIVMFVGVIAILLLVSLALLLKYLVLPMKVSNKIKTK